ncbi:MAG: hypothetical protein GF416_04620 [Candidatus Altiarchaeales archaeon]|nr:hypothetical protein [Candidatus Altiarchaeales archaeon]MBD3416404.1 hypothetical protein [Candidatus Altiarchaeales archaeon]
MKQAMTVLLMFSLVSMSSAQWSDCPFDIVNDSSPGLCGRYVDTGGDSICDRSQPYPEETTPDSEDGETRGDEVLKSQLIPTISRNQNARKVYNMIPLVIFLTVVYLVTLRAADRGTISLRTHRRIWNVMLLISFLVSGLLGVLLVLRINYGIIIQPPFNMLYWHVEAGIAMATVSIFHILWHIQYFKSILSKP